MAIENQHLEESPEVAGSATLTSKFNQPAPGLMPLMCYRFKNDKWEFHELPEGRWNIEVGNNPEESVVKIKEPYADGLHLIFQLAGERWYIIESGSNSITSVNGFKKRQGTIAPFSAAFLKVGDTPMIFTAGTYYDETAPTLAKGEQTALVISDNPEESKLDLSREAEAGQYSMVTTKGTKNFSVNKTILIGSNPLCDIRTKGEDFAAVVSNFRNRLYLYSPKNKEVYADTVLAEKPLALKHESEIMIEGNKMAIKLPKELQSSGSGGDVPDLRKVNLALLEVKHGGKTGKLFLLPGVGSLASVGRGSNCYFTLDSKKISRQHAQLMIQENEVMVIDSETRNGTYVDNVRITKLTVKPGHEIRFADKSFLLCYSE